MAAPAAETATGGPSQWLSAYEHQEEKKKKGKDILSMNTFPQENKRYHFARSRKKKLARRSTSSAQGRRDKTPQIRILHGVPLLPGDHPAAARPRALQREQL